MNQTIAVLSSFRNQIKIRFIYYSAPQANIMMSGAGGSVPHRNTVKHIINKSVEILSAHQIYQKNGLGDGVIEDGPLLEKWRGFTETYKNVQQGFLRTIYAKAKSRLRTEKNSSDLALESLRGNQQWVPFIDGICDECNFEDHLETIRDFEDSGNREQKAQIPYLRDQPFFVKDGLEKLSDLIQIAVNHSEINQCITNDLLHQACFEQLTDYHVRSWRINSRNVNHFSDDSNTTDLQQLFIDFWSSQRVQEEIIGATKAIILMQCLTDLAFGDEESTTQNLKEYYEQTLDDYSRERANNGTTQNHLEIIKRIEFLKWGPQQYKRNPKVVGNALNVLHGAGVIALRGWGGVGKTALATYMIFDAAKKQTFDRYITSSTKVGSAQKEKNIHYRDGPSLIPSDRKTSIYDSLLTKDKKISGSIRRLCLQIIRSADGDTRNYDGSHTRELIDAAINCMKEYKMLICIDNFEDIEEPENIQFSDVVQEDLLEESKNFKIFFAQWTQEYQALRKNNADEVYSQVIVTTRSRGLGASPYDVPYLSASENFDLFKSKIHSRIMVRKEKNIALVLPQETIVTIDQNRSIIDECFEQWSYVDGNEVIQGIHPMNTISAAVEVAHNDLQDITNAINEWDPKGKKAKSIAEYCASKVFTSLPILDKAIITELLIRNRPFGSNEIVTIAYDWLNQNPGVEQTFGHDEAHQFLLTYHSERDWFERSMNDTNKYRWKQEIFVHVIQREEVEEQLKVRNRQKGLEKNETRHQSTFDPTKRRALYDWINNESRNPRNLNTLITPLLAEQNLEETQIASAYIMLFLDRLLPKFNQIFDGVTLDKTLINIVSDFNKRKTKVAASKTIKMGEVGHGGGKLVSSPQGLALSAGLNALVSYISRIQSEFNQALKNSDNYGKSLLLYSDMVKHFERYHREELFPLEVLIEEYRFVLNELMELPVDYIHDTGSFNQMVQDFITDVSRHMKLIPTGINHSFNLSAEYLEVCKLIVKAGNEMFDWSCGGHERTCGSIYWASLHTLANIEAGDYYQNLALDMLEQHYSNGRHVTRNILHANLFQIYHNRVTKAKKQLFWTIDELMAPSGAQFGTLGKIVYMSPTDKNTRPNVEVVYNENLNTELRQEIKQTCNYFRVINHAVNRLYVAPILDENNEPLMFEQLFGFSEVRKAVAEIIISTDLAENPLSWNELKQLISTRLTYDPWLSLSHYESEKDAVMEFKRLVEREDLKSENIQENMYLKIGEFSEQDKAKLRKFGYEAKFTSNYSQITGSIRGKKGHMWPRNPLIMARIVHKFIDTTSKDNAMTYQQMKNYVKNKFGEKDGDVRHHVIEDCFNALKEYDPYWSQRTIDFEEEIYCDHLALISALQKRAFWRCKKWRKDGKIFLSKDLVNCYLEGVKVEYAKITKK